MRLAPKQDLVDMTINCKFCGNDRGDTHSSCEGCGASSVDSFSQAKMEQTATDSFVETTKKVLEDAQKSRLYLTGTAILFAVLFGVFWQKSQPTTIALTSANETTADTDGRQLESQLPPYSEHALMLASVPAAVGIFEQKAIFSSAMIDISYLNVMIHEHYLDTGKFPNNLLDLNLVESTMISRNVSGLQIENEGVITWRPGTHVIRNVIELTTPTE